MTNWQNWSGSVQTHARALIYPETLEEISGLVQQAAAQGRKVRVVGSGHSFTPLVATPDWLVSLDRFQGIEAVDDENKRVTVRAGTKLHALGELLHARGYTMENLGDIDAQSIAGAISTGTHGTGPQFGSLSTQVAALSLITANGQLVTCSESENPDLFKAAQVSLGLLGIVVLVTLKVQDAYRLHYTARRESLADCLANLENYKQNNRHFEFYYFPHTDYVQTKFMNQTTAPRNTPSLGHQFNDVVLENLAFGLLSEACRALPKLSAGVSRLSTQLLDDTSRVGWSHQIFATPRWVRFQEMEYNIPVDAFPDVLGEVKAALDRYAFAVHFPLECRFVKADDIWLSPAYQRDSAYIAVHSYRGMPYKLYFGAMEAIFRRYEGRPHWGKHHSRTKADLAQLYPRWQNFLAMRQNLDPEGLFLNDYLRALVG